VKLLPPQTDSRHLCLIGDPDRLKGVLLNLYSNAAKFTRNGFLCVRARKVSIDKFESGAFIDVRASYSACLATLRSIREVCRPPRLAKESLSVNTIDAINMHIINTVHE
jgi:hypothetical protein